MEKGKGVLLIIAVVVFFMLFAKGCIDSERQDAEIQRKKYEWDMKIEENRRKYGK